MSRTSMDAFFSRIWEIGRKDHIDIVVYPKSVTKKRIFKIFVGDRICPFTALTEEVNKIRDIEPTINDLVVTIKDRRSKAAERIKKEMLER